MKKIDEIAERVRERLGIPDDLLLNSLDVLRRMKFLKFIADFREENNLPHKSDAHWDDRERVILLSSQLWKQIQTDDSPDSRFTVLHEVGHAILGHSARNRFKLGRPQYGRSIEVDEWEADEFALAFALPLRFAERLTDPLDPEVTGAQFGLPPQMANRRLVDLQRALRNAENSEKDVDEDDSYADAMRAMRINALNWNSVS